MRACGSQQPEIFTSNNGAICEIVASVIKKDGKHRFCGGVQIKINQCDLYWTKANSVMLLNAICFGTFLAFDKVTCSSTVISHPLPKLYVPICL